VVQAPGSRQFVKMFTERVGRQADDPTHRASWLEALRSARADPSNTPVIDEELKRLGATLSKATGG
jgi:hypothetical protein